MSTAASESTGSAERYLLEVRGVSKGFPGVQALSDMHLTLRRDEVLALVGENGAGKSTLMKLLSGIYTADSGDFWLDGEPLRVSGTKDALEQGISIIHQEFNLMPHLNVAENIFIGREPRRLGFISDRTQLRRGSELLERLGLPLDPRQLVGNLTVAKQQMVEIAKALSYDARVLIMDEPTAALNDAEVSTLHDLIRRFKSPETGVIYISHRMDELKVISDRITVIRDGEYIDTVGTAETSMREVISLMVGRALTSDATPEGVRPDREPVLEVVDLSTKELLRGRVVHPAEGRDPRIRGPDGCRPHRGRAGPRRCRPSLLGHHQPARQDDQGAKPRGSGAAPHRVPLRGSQAPWTAAGAGRRGQRGPVVSG